MSVTLSYNDLVINVAVFFFKSTSYKKPTSQKISFLNPNLKQKEVLQSLRFLPLTVSITPRSASVLTSAVSRKSSNAFVSSASEAVSFVFRNPVTVSSQETMCTEERLMKPHGPSEYHLLPKIYKIISCYRKSSLKTFSLTSDRLPIHQEQVRKDACGPELL